MNFEKHAKKEKRKKRVEEEEVQESSSSLEESEDEEALNKLTSEVNLKSACIGNRVKRVTTNRPKLLKIEDYP